MPNFITRNIPNTLTCCNLLSGCVATCHAFCGHQGWALAFIIIGAVFDFFDGMSARLLKVSSPIGKELDSLADDVTFGVAPATMVFTLLFQLPYPEWLSPFRHLLPATPHSGSSRLLLPGHIRHLLVTGHLPRKVQTRIRPGSTR